MSTRPSTAAAIPLQAVLISVGIHILWGAMPVSVKYSLWVFPPLWTAFFRFLVGALCVAAFAALTGVRIWPERGEWRALVILGVLLTVQIGTMNIGYDRTTAVMSSVLIATNPLFAAAFAHFYLPGDRLRRGPALGLLVALAGTVIVLTGGGAAGALQWDNWGNWIVLGSAMLLGSRLIVAAGMLQRIHEVRVAVWQMTLSLPLFAAGGLAFETIRWDNLAWQPIAGILYQGAIVAGLGFLTSFYLMRRYTASVIVSFNFVSPVAGVLLGAWLLGEPVGVAVLAGMGAVAIGLVLVARR